MCTFHMFLFHVFFVSHVFETKVLFHVFERRQKQGGLGGQDKHLVPGVITSLGKESMECLLSRIAFF